MNKKIQDRLDSMYANTKSRKFIQHLVKAYIPVCNVEKQWAAPMRNFRCCLSSQPLSGGNPMLESIKDKTLNKELLDYMIEPFNDNNTNNTSKVEKIFKDRELGVKGVNTETYMSVSMFREFYQWVLLKILNGDSDINESISEFKTEDMIKSVSKFAKTDKELARIESLTKKLRRNEKIKAMENANRTTLGDIFNLEALK